MEMQDNILNLVDIYKSENKSNADLEKHERDLNKERVT